MGCWKEELKMSRVRVNGEGEGCWRDIGVGWTRDMINSYRN